MTSRTASNVVWSYIGWASSIAAPLILIPLCVRFLGKELYGQWLVILSTVGFLGLTNPGLGQTVYNRVAEAAARKEEGDVRQVVATAFYIYALIAVLVIFVVLIGVRPLSSLLSIRSSMLLTAFLIYFLMSFASMPIATYLSALQGYERVDQYNAVGSAANAGRIVITAAALIIGFKLIALALIQGGSKLLQGAAGWILTRRQNCDIAPWPSRFSVRICSELFKPSLGFFTLQVSHTMVFGVDNLVIGYVLGAVDVTRYAVPYRIILMLEGLFATLLSALRPRMTVHWARNESASLRKTYGLLLRLALFYGVATALMLWLAGPTIIRLWVGPGVFPGMTVFGLEIALLTIQTVMAPADLILVATTRHYGYAKMAMMEAALNLGLSFWWAHTFGLAGVIAGTVIARIVTTGWYMLLAAHRTIGISSRGLICELAPGGAVAAISIAAVALLYVNAAPFSDLMALGMSMLTGSALVIFYGRFGFTRDDWSALLSWTPKANAWIKPIGKEGVA